ncbi:hypothetical protein ACVXG8_10150 [Escherichia coli]
MKPSDRCQMEACMNAMKKFRRCWVTRKLSPTGQRFRALSREYAQLSDVCAVLPMATGSGRYRNRTDDAR